MAVTTYLPPKSYVRMDASLQAKFLAFRGSMLAPEASMGLASCEGQTVSNEHPHKSTSWLRTTQTGWVLGQLLGQPVPEGGFCCMLAEKTRGLRGGIEGGTAGGSELMVKYSWESAGEPLMPQ